MKNKNSLKEKTEIRFFVVSMSFKPDLLVIEPNVIASHTWQIKTLETFPATHKFAIADYSFHFYEQVSLVLEE